MTAVPLVPFNLAATVANNGTVAMGYPTGYVQADFTGENASATGQVAINGNDIYSEAEASVAFTYGAGSITVQNLSGVSWLLGSQVRAQAAFGAPASGGGGGGSITVEDFVALAEDAAADVVLAPQFAAATSTAIQTLDAPATEELGEFLVAPLVTAPAVLTFQGWRDGASDSEFWTQPFDELLNTYQVWADAATLTLDFGDAAEPDIDLGKARSKKHQVNTGASCNVDLDGISGTLIGQTIKIRWVMDAAASVTVGVVTGNGVTVTEADDVDYPGIGASIGDWLEADVFLASATSAIVVGYEKSDVTNAPLAASATTGATVLPFEARRNEVETTITGNITDVDPSALALYGTGVWHLIFTTSFTVAFAHSGLTFIVPESSEWNNGTKTFTPTANRRYKCVIRRAATSTYEISMGEALA